MIVKTVTPHEIRAAVKRIEDARRVEPRAQSVRYSPRSKTIALVLKSGVTVSFPVEALWELAGATGKQLKSLRLGFGGQAITLEERGVDISVTGLMRDLIGVTSAARVLGAKGGAATSAAKAAASRKNGKRGGRPRTSASRR